MRVPVHEPRHQDRTAAVNDLITRLCGRVRAEADNLPIGDAKMPGLDPSRIELHEQCVAKESRHEQNLPQSALRSRSKSGANDRHEILSGRLCALCVLCGESENVQHASPLVESFDLTVPFVDLGKHLFPKLGSPKLAQLVGRTALLLHPGEI